MSDDPSSASSTLSPDISYKPPAVYGAFFLFGLLINLMWPIEILNFWAQIAIGLIGIGIGGGVVAWAIRTLKTAGTTFKLGAPVSAFVRHGPYKFSRNPIYLGLSFIYISLCILFDAPIAALLIVPLTMVMNRFVIAREEVFLKSRFGADYERYLDVVSRWI